jgi:hypothetical protein
LRLRQLQRQETIIERQYNREIYWKRLQLAQIYEALNESSDYTAKGNRMQTPVSFYSIKMRRNQSAPPNSKRTAVENRSQSRPNTTPTPIRRNKRAMSVFKEIKLKPQYRTLGNMLLLIDNEKKSYQNEWSTRSSTMLNLKNEK